MITWGPWHPDSAGINTPVVRVANNCLPGTVGFRPLYAPLPVDTALPTECRGAAALVQDDGSAVAFAGTATKLYKLVNGVWVDVSRVSGGAYSCGDGELWQFFAWGTQAVAFNHIDGFQVIDMAAGANFADLAGGFASTPPKGRYGAVVRDFVMVGNLFGDERGVQWSGINDITDWRVGGPQQSDYQEMLSGGPVRGILGGEVAYVFQSDKVTRWTYVPGSPTIFQVDEVQGGRGLKSPHSLVRLGRDAYYVASDGIYHFDVGSGATRPLGIGKWSRTWLEDCKPGADLQIKGGIDPVHHLIYWAYVSRSNVGTKPDKVLIYEWTIDEATTADIAIECMVPWLSQGVDLDSMNPYGSMETLPFSLDSPFWKGGASLMGVFTSDHRLSFFEGDSMAASFETSDGQEEMRRTIIGTVPAIDASSIAVSLSMREKDGDAVVWDTPEELEDTGVCPAHISGNIARARVTVPASQGWSAAKGIATNFMKKKAGRR